MKATSKFLSREELFMHTLITMFTWMYARLKYYHVNLNRTEIYAVAVCKPSNNAVVDQG